MSDLVNRSEVKNIAKGFTFTFAEERQRYMDFLDYCLENAPTVDAVPVVHGSWIEPSHSIVTSIGHIHYATCSSCRRTIALDDEFGNFCPNCGADMRKKV